MKVWVLFHGVDSGNSEDFSIFYAKPTVFDDEKLALAAEAQVKADYIHNGETNHYTEILESELNPAYVNI